MSCVEAGKYFYAFMDKELDKAYYLLIKKHIDAALEANATEVDVDDVHAIYRLVLIEILALSYAVRAPSNWVMPATEFTA